MLREARHDKKKCDDRIDVVLPVTIGECVVERMTFKNFESMLL